MEWLIGGVILYMIIKAINSNKVEEEKKAALSEEEARRKAAEDYIMNSGDQEAIKQLMLIRANPANSRQQFAQAARGGNDTMRMAFGVMTGVIAANMITTAMTVAAMEQALTEASAELDQAIAEIDPDFGGLDGMADTGAPEVDADGEGVSDFFDNLFS